MNARPLSPFAAVGCPTRHGIKRDNPMLGYLVDHIRER